MSDLQSVVPPEVQEMARDAQRSPASNDWMIVWGAAILVGLAATAWVWYWRTHRRHRHRHHHHPHPADPAAIKPAATADPPGHAHSHSHHSHGRKRRWGGRRRNPTLAQTGGLPPVRDDSTSTQTH